MDNNILNKVKLSLRIADSIAAYDEELNDIIDAALLDLGVAGVVNTDTTDKLILRAVTTYTRLHFGAPGDYGDYEKLKKAYDEQKAQMSTSSNYNEEVRP